jgi:hypothetical protein
MLEGYAHALKDPKATAPEPSVAVRIRSNFGTGTVAWLDRVEALMIPMDADKQAKMEQAGGQYVAQMLAQNPTLPASFFTLKKIGSLKMGVGSAHSAKFLGRVEGPTKAPDDDVILETKEVSQMSPGGCISGESRDPLRVIVGQTRLSNPPQQFLGYVELEGRMFYVHQWRVHYTELDIEDIQTGKELEEIAFDVGVQLGRGHPKQIADPYGKELRDTLAAALVRVAPEIRSAAKELADMNISAWKEFTEAASR